jgi:hypothetical protein
MPRRRAIAQELNIKIFCKIFSPKIGAKMMIV